MTLNEFTSRAVLSAACRRYESAHFGPELCDPPDPTEIRAVLTRNRPHVDGHDFAAMWDTDAMDRFQEALFTDFDHCADLMALIGRHTDEFPLLDVAINRLAEDLAEEL